MSKGVILAQLSLRVCEGGGGGAVRVGSYPMKVGPTKETLDRKFKIQQLSSEEKTVTIYFQTFKIIINNNIILTANKLKYVSQSRRVLAPNCLGAGSSLVISLLASDALCFSLIKTVGDIC